MNNCPYSTTCRLAFTITTAVEMWEAYRNGATVITISPMALNWTVKFLSHELYADVEQFEQDVKNGRLARRIGEILDGRRGPAT